MKELVDLAGLALVMVVCGAMLLAEPLLTMLAYHLETKRLEAERRPTTPKEPRA